MRVFTAIKLTLFGVALFLLAEYSMKDHDNYVYLFTWLGSIALVGLGFLSLFGRSSNA
jgi:hypothetical protein